MSDERTTLLNSNARIQVKNTIFVRICLCLVLLGVFLFAVLAITAAAFPSLFKKSSNDSSEANTIQDGPTMITGNLLQLSIRPPNGRILEKSLSDENMDQLKAAVLLQDAGQRALYEKDKREENSPNIDIDSAAYKHQKIIMATNRKARELSRFGYQEEGALRFMGDNNTIDFNQLFLFDDLCRDEKIECNVSYTYRSFNGSCNNLFQPNSYGVAYKMFRRALPADYDDGINKPRTLSKNKIDILPSARTISLEVHRPNYKIDLQFTVMLAVWGQFLDHDITATALNQKENGEPVACCSPLLNDDDKSPECFPVIVDPDDPLYELHNISCIEFIRSAAALKCYLGPREQMNQVTAFIDGSVVYGVEESLVNSLRVKHKGLLKMYISEDNRMLLPISYNMEDGCNRQEEKAKGRYCFLSGDPRANENLHLTSMHLIWARQHNRLAKKLLELNGHWNDERLFQESRKILGAQMQHITYNEFLPILLGKSVMSKHDLLPKQNGYFEKYHESIDPTIANEFATAAFRFAHSIIPNLIRHLDANSSSFIKMREMLFDPFKLYGKGELDRALKSAIHSNLQPSDAYFSEVLKTHLFDNEWKQLNHQQCSGLDLVALNIQRGRDHGIPAYIHWRHLCGWKDNITKFEDLEPLMDTEALKKIKTIYRNVEDIDLYTGALSENPLDDSILGPTLRCIILDQFIRLKYGDRFWYETNNMPQRFTLDQLREIRKTTLAGILCKNGDEELKDSEIQPMVMIYKETPQISVPCLEILEPNLIYWKEM